jgi:two-component system, NarL family, sensor kinase
MIKIILITTLLFFSFSNLFGQNKNEEIKKLHKIFDAQISLIDIDRDSAKVIFKRIEPSLKKLNDEELNFRFHHEWSRIGYLDSDYEGALNHANLALILSKKLNNKVFEARASRLMMIMNHRLNIDKEAMKFAVITSKLLEKSKDSLMLASSYNSLSSFYADFGMLEKQLFFGLKGIVAGKKYKDVKGLLGAMNNTATVYLSQKEYFKANEILKEQLKLSTLQNKPRSIERAYTNLVQIYVQTDNLKQLNIYFPKYKAFVEENGDEIMKEDNWSNFYDYEAKYHLYNLKFNDAEKSIDKGLLFAEKSTYKQQLLNLYMTKADIYTAWHKFEKATVYFEKSDSLEKSLRDLDMIKFGEDLETKYKLSQKQNEILQKDIALQKSQNNMAWVLGGFGLLSILGGLGFYSFRKKQQTKALEAELITQKTERQRIAAEMHDELGGNLTSLMYLAHNLKDKASKNKEVDKIIQTSGNISDSINEIVWALNQEQNLLADWVFYVRGKTAELFENAGMQYTYTISEPIPERMLSNIEKRNLYLVVKEAINNAIKHSKANKYEVNMDFERGISISIRDNGIGFIENGTPKAGGGNGLKNMSRRMGEISGSISWSNGEGAIVEIKL